jgi:hypothetical protein
VWHCVGVVEQAGRLGERLVVRLKYRTLVRSSVFGLVAVPLAVDAGSISWTNHHEGGQT